MNTRVLFALFAIVCVDAQRLSTVWTYQQPASQSALASWRFAQAGSLLIPYDWTSVSMQWSFSGILDSWYAGQASIGAAGCYSPVTPTDAGDF